MERPVDRGSLRWSRWWLLLGVLALAATLAACDGAEIEESATAEPEAVEEPTPEPDPEPEPVGPLLGEEEHPSMAGSYDVVLTVADSAWDDTGEPLLPAGEERQRVYTISVDDPDCVWTECVFEIVAERAFGIIEDRLSFDGSTYRMEPSWIQDCGAPNDPIAADGYHHTLSMEFEVVEAELVDGAWVATVWRGTAVERAEPTEEAEEAGCPAATIEYAVEAHRQADS